MAAQSIKMGGEAEVPLIARKCVWEKAGAGSDDEAATRLRLIVEPAIVVTGRQDRQALARR